MKNKKITNFERVLYDLPIEELKAYLKEYDKRNNTDIQKSLNTVSLSEMQNKVESVGLQPTCPCCGSLKAKKKGLRGDTQRYLCLDCNKSYTLFSNTFVEGSTFSWDTWVKLLQLTIEGKSIDKTLEILEDDHDLEGINKKSILSARHKLLYAMATMPKPTLQGVVQVDETFFRENQKGTRTDKGNTLINVIPDKLPVRLPRRGRMPSRMGVMGPEYACAVCALDNKGYAVSHITSILYYSCLRQLTACAVSAFHAV